MRSVAALPDALVPDIGARGFATRDRAGLAVRTAVAWDLAAAYAESCDLQGSARTRGRTGLQVLIPVGRWPDSRGLDDVLADAKQGRVHRIDQPAYEAGLRDAHQDATPDEVVDALRRAAAEVSTFLGSRSDDRFGLTVTASPLGPVPMRTLCHAAVYQLGVSALDLEPCAPAPVPEELLDLALVALVDTAACLAARRGLNASLVADPSRQDADSRVWGFGVADGDWVTVELSDPVGPAIAATTRAILDITSGRTANVPGLVKSGALRLHDIPGLLHLAPLVDEIPGIPGAAALRAASTSLSIASSVLGSLGRFRRPSGTPQK